MAIVKLNPHDLMLGFLIGACIPTLLSVPAVQLCLAMVLVPAGACMIIADSSVKWRNENA